MKRLQLLGILLPTMQNHRKLSWSWIQLLPFISCPYKLRTWHKTSCCLLLKQWYSLNSTTSSPPSPWATPALPAPGHEPNHVIHWLKKYFANKSPCNAHSPFSVLAPFQGFSSNPAVHLRAGITTCCREICRDQISPEPVGSYSKWKKDEKMRETTTNDSERSFSAEAVPGVKSALLISMSIPWGDRIWRGSCFPWVSLLSTAQLSVHQL